MSESKDYVDIDSSPYPKPLSKEELQELREEAKRKQEARMREREKRKQELRDKELEKHERIARKRENQIKQGMVGFTEAHKQIFNEMRKVQDERNWMFRKGTATSDRVLKEGTKEYEFALLKEKLLSLPLDYGAITFAKRYWYDGGVYQIVADQTGKPKVKGFGVPAKLILDEQGNPIRIELKVPCMFLKDAYFKAVVKVKLSG